MLNLGLKLKVWLGVFVGKFGWRWGIFDINIVIVLIKLFLICILINIG